MASRSTGARSATAQGVGRRHVIRLLEAQSEPCENSCVRRAEAPRKHNIPPRLCSPEEGNLEGAGCAGVVLVGRWSRTGFRFFEP